MLDWSQAQSQVVIFAGVVGLLTVAAGIWRVAIERRETNKRPFLEKQLELCFEAVGTASRLATETDPVKWETARSHFWLLYWGPLSIVEDTDVESAMVELGRLIPNEPSPSVTLPLAALQVRSYNLAHAVRQLILSSWRIGLPPLKVDPQDVVGRLTARGSLNFAAAVMALVVGIYYAYIFNKGFMALYN